MAAAVWEGERLVRWIEDWLDWLLENLILFGGVVGFLALVFGGIFSGVAFVVAIKEGCYIAVPIIFAIGFGLYCLGRHCLRVID